MSREIKLPVAIVSRPDLARLLRELEKLDDYLEQARIRGQGASELPPANKGLDELAEVNSVQLHDQAQRQELKNGLGALLKSAPQVHISFASTPSPQFLGKLVTWFRGEIHPGILLQIGLQPSIAAGCTIRTTNKFFDLSLRQHLLKNRAQLIEKMHGSLK